MADLVSANAPELRRHHADRHTDSKPQAPPFAAEAIRRPRLVLAGRAEWRSLLAANQTEPQLLRPDYWWRHPLAGRDLRLRRVTSHRQREGSFRCRQPVRLLVRPRGLVLDV